ncbi:hypothetical protein OSH99_26445, partial [Mycobacterium ulcerans]
MAKLESHCVWLRYFAFSRASHAVVKSLPSTNQITFAPLNPGRCRARNKHAEELEKKIERAQSK